LWTETVPLRAEQGEVPIRDRISSIAFVSFFVVAVQAIACSIPVFRYALENWQPDSYTAFVLYRDELNAGQQNLVETLQSNKFEGTSAANLVVKTVNLNADLDENEQRLRDEYGEQELPLVVVRNPVKRGLPATVFEGALTPAGVSQLIQSPLRTDIKDRLLKGDSVVWVYLECGNKEKDDELFGMLNTELARLQNEIELPEIEEEDLDELSGSPESLRIQFSAVRLSREDEAETAFRDMLLHVEHDLHEASYISEPMAFPVFGRGRALYALVGDGVAPDLVEEACRFLTGACQCTVKAENPGVDILMQVEWDKFVKPTEAVDASLPPLAGFSGFGERVENTGSDAVAPAIADHDDLSSSDPQENGADVVPVRESSEQVHVEAAEDSPSSGNDNTVLQNSMYVLMLAGCAVVVATLFVLRRSAG
jgi:hypothetical protein